MQSGFIFNRRFINNLTLFTIMLTAMSLTTTSQETVPVSNSELVNTKLPANASRITEGSVPAEFNQTFDYFLKEGEGKIAGGEREVLAWTGNYKNQSEAAKLTRQIQTSFRNASWQYESLGTQDGVEFFNLYKEGSPHRLVMGFFVQTDEFVVCALMELHANDGKQTNSNAAIKTGNGDVSDYSFTTPVGWSRSDSANKIVLTKGDENRIEFLPLANSSGNLETDANRILWQVFKGCDSWYALGFEADYGTFEKGITAQGLEYFRAYRYAKNASERDSGLATTQFDAIILLVKLDDRVAIVTGKQPFQRDIARDSALAAMDLILYDLKFKSVTNSYNLKNELLGSWAAASGSVALAYTFNANGSFNKGSAIGYRTSRDAQIDNLHTTSYGTTETYNLSGNILTQNYKRTREVVKYKIRIYQTKYDKQEWQHKVGFLPIANPEGGTIVLRRSN